MKIDESVLQALAQLPVRRLYLSYVKCDTKKIRQMPFFKRLYVLRFVESGKADDLVQAVLGDDELTDLQVNTTSVSPGLVSQLGQCKRLHAIEFTGMTISRVLMQALSTLPGPYRITFKSCNLTIKDLQQLASFKSVGSIRLDARDFKGLGSQIEVAVPKVKFRD